MLFRYTYNTCRSQKKVKKSLQLKVNKHRDPKRVFQQIKEQHDLKIFFVSPKFVFGNYMINMIRLQRLDYREQKTSFKETNVMKLHRLTI